jgi:hypothetical protein
MEMRYRRLTGQALDQQGRPSERAWLVAHGYKNMLSGTRKGERFCMGAGGHIDQQHVDPLWH